MNPYDPTPAGPTNLTGAPARHPVYAVPLVVGHASGSRYLPPTDAPLLSVRPNGDVTVTKAMLLAIPHLKAGAPITVVPPVDRNRTDPWYLDTRSSAPYRLPRSGVARFSIPLVGRRYFQIPAMASEPGKFGGAKGLAGYYSRLVFRLGAEMQEEVCVTDGKGNRICQTRGTGYFLLVPVDDIPMRSETHCLRGHLITPENTFTTPSRPNKPRCRECHREDQRNNGLAHRSLPRHP